MSTTLELNGEASTRPSPVLARVHTGMRVDYKGLLRQAREALDHQGESALAEMLRQLTDHLTELGDRYYAGDAIVVDEFLQLYCVGRDLRATITNDTDRPPGQ